MALDVADARGVHARRALGHGNRLGLSGHARRGEGDLVVTIVVQAPAADQRVDVISVGERILHPAQRHDARAVTEHGSGRVRVERAAMTVVRDHAALLVEVTALLRKGDRDPAREREIALKGFEALAGLRDGDERRGAGAGHGHRRTGQTEPKRDPRSERVAERAHELLVVAELVGRDEILDTAAVGQDVVQEVG